MRILGRDVSITSVSTPLVGLGWKVSNSDREVLRKLVVFLEDRRVLYAPLPAEVPEHVVASIITIRHELTRILEQKSDDSPLAPTLRALRTECGNFLTRHAQPGYSFPTQFAVGLGELRGVF